MSLIRALSNPEGLYIWGGIDEAYNISTGRDWKLSNCGPDQPIMVVPCSIFEAAATKWYETWEPDIEIEGFRVQNDLHIFTDTQEPVPAGWGLQQMLDMADGKLPERETFWGIKISYKDLYAYLYQVTWVYATRRFESHDATS